MSMRNGIPMLPLLIAQHSWSLKLVGPMASFMLPPSPMVVVACCCIQVKIVAKFGLPNFLGDWLVGRMLSMLSVSNRLSSLKETAKFASACSQAWQCEVIDSKTFLDRALAGEVKETVIVCGCVNDLLIWQGLGVMNVAHGMASPPCQPWSSAGAEHGMSSVDGRVFSDLLKMAGRLRMLTLMTENVPAIVFSW